MSTKHWKCSGIVKWKNWTRNSSFRLHDNVVPFQSWNARDKNTAGERRWLSFEDLLEGPMPNFTAASSHSSLSESIASHATVLVRPCEFGCVSSVSLQRVQCESNQTSVMRFLGEPKIWSVTCACTGATYVHRNVLLEESLWIQNLHNGPLSFECCYRCRNFYSPRLITHILRTNLGRCNSYFSAIWRFIKWSWSTAVMSGGIFVKYLLRRRALVVTL